MLLLVLYNQTENQCSSAAIIIGVMLTYSMPRRDCEGKTICWECADVQTHQSLRCSPLCIMYQTHMCTVKIRRWFVYKTSYMHFLCRLGIMTPAASSWSAASHFWFQIDNS